MASISWPVGLPQKVLMDGYSDSLGDNVVRKSLSTGPPRTRKRATSAVKPVSCSYGMSTSQWSTLKTFFETTTNFGADTFTWPGPAGDESYEVQFSQPPRRSPNGAGRWIIEIALEIQP